MRKTGPEMLTAASTRPSAAGNRRADATAVKFIFLLVHIVNHVNSLRVT